RSLAVRRGLRRGDPRSHASWHGRARGAHAHASAGIAYAGAGADRTQLTRRAGERIEPRRRRLSRQAVRAGGTGGAPKGADPALAGGWQFVAGAWTTRIRKLGSHVPAR